MVRVQVEHQPSSISHLIKRFWQETKMIQSRSILCLEIGTQCQSKPLAFLELVLSKSEAMGLMSADSFSDVLPVLLQAVP